jgi:hypothetical protein
MRFSVGVAKRLAALGLTVTLGGGSLYSGPVSPGSAGTLTGRIFVADGVTPRGGVVVKAANLNTSRVYASRQTDAAGRYSLASLPAGQYQVAVETAEGLYVNPDRIPVLQGRRTLFSLALDRPDPAARSDRRADDPPEEPETPPQEPPQQPATPPEPPGEEQKPEEMKPEEQPKEKTPAEQEAEEKKKKKGAAAFWRGGWGVAIGLGGGAVVLGLLADSIAGESDAVPSPSPSTP